MHTYIHIYVINCNPFPLYETPPRDYGLTENVHFMGTSRGVVLLITYFFLTGLGPLTLTSPQVDGQQMRLGQCPKSSIGCWRLWRAWNNPVWD